ncbi:DUF4393 domain-containing protein [Listeria aquatica]|uniref:DUF4393 domain-containing protein n=1 Tax=Listeria aquatica TaxID=1494960 RepID=UPI003EF668A8
MNFSDLIPFFTGVAGGAASTGAFKGPIETLQNWWYLTFGHALSDKAAFLKAKNEIDIEAYKKNILDEVTNVPPDFIQEPQMNILGPSLEASRYYISEEEMRQLFAKLIASAMDQRKNNVIHPAFVEIIKQMTALDAQNLSCFQPVASHTIAKIIIKISNQHYFTYASNLFLANTEQPDPIRNASSITNLSRLGLVTLTYSEKDVSKENYELYKKTEPYYEALKEIKRVNDSQDEIENLLKTIPPDTLEQHDELLSQFKKNSNIRYEGVEIKKGLATLTPLGHDFCSVCLK